jgi:hypothetical protein
MSRMNHHRGARVRLLNAWFPVVFWLCVGHPGTAAAQYQLELTFDDGDDYSSTPELNNLETGTPVTARLGGTARRSGLHEGRYGRAADLPGAAGHVEVSGWTPAPELVFHVWVSARGTDAGEVIAQGGRWRLFFDAGALRVAFFHADGGTSVSAASLPWPSGGGFHHVTVGVAGLTGLPTVTVTLDFADTIALSAERDLDTWDQTLRLGSGLDGLIDEVILANRAAATLDADQDRFNRDPFHCPPGTVCVEEVMTLVPRTFVRQVPVRWKSVHDPAVCAPATPCPLLFAIQGGGACNNDYAMPADVVPMVRAGFVVVTIDPYCEGEGETFVPETEVSQFVAVKDRVFAAGPVADRLTGPDYHATGCSHGAEAVLVWAMREPDHPLRTFARSGGVSGFCARVAGELCMYLGGTEHLPVDVESEEARLRHQDTDMVGWVTAQTVATREIARSWGVNLEGPRCPSGGLPGCLEEGLWGMTYGSRRFATRWEAEEDPLAPTGYFVEDVGADCRHCAPAGSVAFECGLCLLRHGRAGMEAACPACLTYDDATIRRGGTGDLCPLQSSWYVDPLADAGPEDDVDVLHDLQGDPGSDAYDPPPAKSDGCACRAGASFPGNTPPAGLALLFLLLVFRAIYIPGTNRRT